MSLYNAVMGFNLACVLILPMLGKKQEEYPRFRDCFVGEDNNSIVVFTRVGGGNRHCGFGEEELYEDENFIKTWDDNYDETYGYYEFKVPDKWKNDFNLIVSGNFTMVSKEYQEYLAFFYPKLAEQGIFITLFADTDDGYNPLMDK